MSRKKTAILTGCNGEVGLKVSEKLFLNDFNVIGIDVTNKRNQYLQKYFQFDLRELSNDSSGAKVKFISDVEETLGHSGVDLLINNAAIQKIDSIKTITSTSWKDVMEVNFYSAVFLSQIILPYLNKSASIINVSSIHSKLTKPGFLSYATSKGALSSFTRNLAIDLEGIARVNAIEPAAIDTKMLRDGFKDKNISIKDLKDFHPSKCIGTTDEIADLIICLSSGSFKFLNGSCIEVSGGISSRLHDPV